MTRYQIKAFRSSGGAKANKLRGMEVGGDRWAVDARELEGDEKAECWEIACAAYPDFASYQELTDRSIPVAVLSRTDS